MDPTSFDRLTRLISSARSRRSLGGLGVGLIGTLLGVATVEAAPCPKGKKRCGKRCIPKTRCCAAARGGCPANHVCRAGGCCIATAAGLRAALRPGGPATIRLCPNTTYRGTFVINRNLTIIGAGAASSILAGGGTRRVVEVTAAVTRAELRGLGIRGGGGVDQGGGIRAAGALLLTRCRVTNNAATSGGGIYVAGSRVTLVNTVVRGNQVTNVGGGITVSARTGALTLRGTSRIEDNAAQAGGGLSAGPGSITLLGQSVVTRNTAVIGGGILARDTAVILRDDSRVEDNTATQTGGGIWIQRVSRGFRLELRDRSRITLNDATSGGGLFVFNDGNHVLILDQAQVVDNTPDNCEPTFPTPTGTCQ